MAKNSFVDGGDYSPLAAKLAAQPGVRNPGALAKYLKKKFSKGSVTPKVTNNK